MQCPDCGKLRHPGKDCKPSIFTRRHYEFLADLLRKHGTLNRTILVIELGIENPMFNEDIFEARVYRK